MAASFLLFLFVLLLFAGWFSRRYYARKVARINAFSKTQFEYAIRAAAGKEQYKDVPPETVVALARSLANERGWDWDEDGFRGALDTQLDKFIADQRHSLAAANNADGMLDVAPRKASELQISSIEHAISSLSGKAAEPDEPRQWIGRKCSWVAYRSDAAERVLEYFNPRFAKPVSWKTALEVIDTDVWGAMTMIPPSINGWVLVRHIGAANYQPPIVFGRWKEEMRQASLRFGEVQHFASYRISESFQYARFENGQLRRWLAVDDGCVRSEEGIPTTEELSLGYDAWRNALLSGSNNLSEKQGTALSKWSADYIPFDLAGKWSVDPSQVSKMGLSKSTVYVVSSR